MSLLVYRKHLHINNMQLALLTVLAHVISTTWHSYYIVNNFQEKNHDFKVKPENCVLRCVTTKTFPLHWKPFQENFVWVSQVKPENCVLGCAIINFCFLYIESNFQEKFA